MSSAVPPPAPPAARRDGGDDGGGRNVPAHERRAIAAVEFKLELDILDDIDEAGNSTAAGLDIDSSIQFSPLLPPRNPYDNSGDDDDDDADGDGGDKAKLKRRSKSVVDPEYLSSVGALSPSAMIAENFSQFDDLVHISPRSNDSSPLAGTATRGGGGGGGGGTRSFSSSSFSRSVSRTGGGKTQLTGHGADEELGGIVCNLDTASFQHQQQHQQHQQQHQRTGNRQPRFSTPAVFLTDDAPLLMQRSATTIPRGGRSSVLLANNHHHGHHADNATTSSLWPGGAHSDQQPQRRRPPTVLHNMRLQHLYVFVSPCTRVRTHRASLELLSFVQQTLVVWNVVLYLPWDPTCMMM